MPPWSPQKQLQNPTCFLKPFWIDLGAQVGPKMHPTSSPRGTQDALGATSLLEAVFGAILVSFLAPRNLENRAPA